MLLKSIYHSMASPASHHLKDNFPFPDAATVSISCIDFIHYRITNKLTKPVLTPSMPVRLNACLHFL